MSKHLQRDLDALKREILSMGSLVEEATNKAISALVDRSRELAEEVRLGDAALDEKEVGIEEDCLKILALHQPVATDLRFVVTVLKVNNDLERMGDLAVNLAKRAWFLAAQSPLEIPLDFAHMGERVRVMVRKSLDALVELDVDCARAVLDMDDEVDEMHKSMYEVLQDVMSKNLSAVEKGVHCLSASRYLERTADLATNIAEDVVFLVEGVVIRHQHKHA